MGPNNSRRDAVSPSKILLEVLLVAIGIGFFINQVANEVHFSIFVNLLGIFFCLLLIFLVAIERRIFATGVSVFAVLLLVFLVFFPQYIPKQVINIIEVRTPVPHPTATSTVQVSPFSTASVKDDWSSGTIDPNIWDVFGGGQVAVVGGHLQITSTLNGDDEGVSSHVKPLVFTGSYVFAEVIDAGNQNLQTWGCYPVTVSLYGPTDDRVLWAIQNGQIKAIDNTSVQTIVVRVDPYNPSTQKFFQIRESQGTIYWDYSTDGSNWTNFASQLSTFDTSKVVIGPNAGNYDTESSTTSCIIGRFNKK